jgi:hypothetical protein
MFKMIKNPENNKQFVEIGGLLKSSIRTQDTIRILYEINLHCFLGTKLVLNFEDPKNNKKT